MAKRKKPIPKRQSQLSQDSIETYKNASKQPTQDNLKKNRGTSRSVKDDDVKQFSIGLKDIDETIVYYFNNVIRPSVIQNGNQIPVPILYGSPERWKAVQKDGFYRDRNGKIQTPLIMFKRESVDKNRELGNKLDANYPHNFGIFQKKFSKKNVYGRFSVLSNREEVDELYGVIIPDYVNLKYSCVVFTEYVEQMNKIVEAINFASDAYWGNPERFSFRAMIDSYNTVTDLSQGKDRVVKTEFTINMMGHIVPDTINTSIANMNKFFSKASISFGVEVENSPYETYADTTDPIFVSAEVGTIADNIVEVSCNENLEGTSGLLATQWTVDDGETNAVTNVKVEDRTIQLTLINDVNYGDTVTLGYTKGANPLTDEAGNELANFSGQAVTNNVAIPSEGSALFHLDGTLDGDEFVDQTGNGRNFTITDKDFTASYFPYKSAATISAPAGDATLIAADVNNFLYDAGGTPNAIPVVSLFQNIDYEDIGFSRHVAQSVDGNDVETQEPYVADFVWYSSVLTGGDLTSANTYYGVPTKSGTAKWVAADGNDGNVGTEVSPYLSIDGWDAVNDGSVIYQKTDSSIGLNVTDYLLIDENNIWSGIGRNVISPSDGSYGLRLRVDFNTAKNIYVNQTSAAITCISTDGLGGGQTPTLENIYVYNSNTVGKGINADCRYIRNCIINLDATNNLIENGASTDVDITGCLLNGDTTSSAMILFSNSGVANFYNNKLVGTVDGLITQGANASPLNCYGNTFNCTVDDGIKLRESKVSVINYNTFNLYAQGSASNAIVSLANSDVTINNNTMNLLGEYDAIGTVLYDCDLDYQNNIVNLYNSNSGSNGILYSNITDADAKTMLISNNRHDLKEGICSKLISVGTDYADGNIGNNSTDVEVSNNRLIGNWDESSATQFHTTFFGYQENADIKYNYISNGGFPIVMEGGLDAIENDNNVGGIYYNLMVNNGRALFVGNWNNLAVYNNTIVFQHTDASEVGGILVSSSNNGATTQDIIIKNNIIACEDDGDFYAIDLDDSNGETIDYNIYYAKGTLKFKIGEDTKTWAEWQAAGHDANGIVLTDEQYNALFTDKDNGDYSLATGSAAIGAGETLAAAYDDGLDSTTDWGDDDTVPSVVTKQQTAPWDIGAYVS